MKNTHNKSDSEILRQKAEELLKRKSEEQILELIDELAFQNEEKAKRADELVIANKELAFQNEEKIKRADELIIANKELAFQNEEKTKRADELIIANKELAFQNEEKTKRADELVIANKELAFQNEEKTKRADELIIANKELAFQNEEKTKRADELVIANKELAFQSEEKIKRAAELIVAKEEIAFQSELLIANKELAFQNEEKAKLADELIIANKELAFQSEEKIKRAAELIVAKEEITFQAELLIANNKALKLSKELEVHQIELEAINDELKQSEQRYQALVEWAPYAALVHRDMKIIYVNPAAVKLFGANSEHDLLGTDVMRLHHPDYHQIVRERICRAVEQGLEAPMIESKYFKLDGTVMDLEVQGRPIIYNGFPSILATFNDVTERRRYEYQLGERLKEIQTLYYLSQLSQRQDLPLIALYQDLTDFLPKGWQYSEIACSRIVIDDVEFRSENFIDSAWKLSAPLLVNNAVKGLIEVAYLKEMPKEDEGPFLKEERELINTLAQQLGTITEQKYAEEEKARQTGLINSLLDSIPDIIFFKDTEGVYLGCNPPFADFVNKSREKIIGKTDYDLFDKEVTGFFRHNDIEMLKQKLPRHNEEWITYPDGRKILLDTVKTPYWSSDGNLIGILGISRDITERKEAENKVIESEDRFNMLAEHSRVITWEVDANGLYTYISDVCLAVLGYEPEEIIGKFYFYTFYPEQQREVLKVAALEFFARKEPFIGFENALESKEKKIVWVSTNGMPMVDDNGQLTGYRGTDTDITGRKQMEEKLNQTSARLTLAMKVGGVGVWDYDMVNNILIWDDQMFALYGLDKKNFIGAYEAWQEGLHPDDLLRGDQEIQMAISGKKEFNTEFRVLWPDGTVRYIRALAVVQRDDSGKALRMIGTNWDITSQKNAEQLLLESKEDLQKTNAEKDKFFSIISHDLRGPFNGFLGLSKLLAESLQDMSQQEIRKMAGAMKNSAVNLFRLLENLLEWSRLQRGITSFEPGPFLLMPMIAESMHPVMDLANKKEIDTIFEIPADLEVFADQYMLSSTIRNLASNAVKFTIKGGKVTMAAKTIPGNSVEISVRDTGIGMSPQMVADLFRLDVQTNRKGTDGEPSSGLGLLLCKEFVEKHGGKLRVESEEGKGSVFYFTIPYHAEGLMKTVSSNSVSNEEKEVQIKRMKILIAEDDEISDSLISAMVDKYSYEVLHVNTGVDAIHACRNNPDIDLVLMDINLGGMNGYEATHQIRQFNNDVVIIAQTAFSLKFDRVLAIEVGCNDYINKPISISELQGLIRKYFTE